MPRKRDPGDVEIRTLDRLTHADLVRLVRGYASRERYVVTVTESRDRVGFRLVRTRDRRAFVKRFPHPAQETARYREVVRQGWSLGAYVRGRLVGFLLAEPRAWNRSVWVWEVGVAASHRRRGVATRLVAELARRASAAGLRTLVCETQTTNAPAIDFYRATGFRVEGIDVSYYSNEDLEKGEVAIFMKLRIAPTDKPVRTGKAGRRRTSK